MSDFLSFRKDSRHFTPRDKDINMIPPREWQQNIFCVKTLGDVINCSTQRTYKDSWSFTSTSPALCASAVSKQGDKLSHLHVSDAWQLISLANCKAFYPPTKESVEASWPKPRLDRSSRRNVILWKQWRHSIILKAGKSTCKSPDDDSPYGREHSVGHTLAGVCRSAPQLFVADVYLKKQTESAWSHAVKLYRAWIFK